MNPENDTWILFGAKQMDVFDKDNIAFVDCLVFGGGLRKSMNEVYRAIVRYGFACSIENLPQHEKEKLWLRANAVRGEVELNRDQLVELSKALYVIECFQTK
jgi:hypothetical protein